MPGSHRPGARPAHLEPRSHLATDACFCLVSSATYSHLGPPHRRPVWLSQLALSLCECSGRGFLTPLSREPAGSEGSHNNGVCTAFLFQMYIALISLHALIMVGFHFLHCFEEDWTSEYVPGHPLLFPGVVCDPGGLGSWLVSWCQGPTPFY